MAALAQSKSQELYSRPLPVFWSERLIVRNMLEYLAACLQRVKTLPAEKFDINRVLGASQVSDLRENVLNEFLAQLDPPEREALGQYFEDQFVLLSARKNKSVPLVLRFAYWLLNLLSKGETGKLW